MKILSKRHADRKLVIVDELPFTNVATAVEGGGFFYCPRIPNLQNLEFKEKSSLGFIDVPKLIEIAWAHVDGDKQ